MMSYFAQKADAEEEMGKALHLGCVMERLKVNELVVTWTGACRVIVAGEQVVDGGRSGDVLAAARSCGEDATTC